MHYNIFFFAALFSLAFIMLVLEFVRSKKLKEQYSLLWLLVGLLMLTLTLWRNLLEKVALMLGIYYAPSLLFVAGILFCFMLILHYSLVISKLHTQNITLAQQIGLLNKKIEDMQNQSDLNRGGTL